MIQGKAVLEFDDGESLPLTAGDALTIPAHLRHRVASVSQDAVWLALRYNS
ncbi:MAG: cupin domain-containing protein [Verrucomicrobiales bacterium]|nr:cupin domain-containing protein [Verrucomicrobiales bacterium]